MTITQLKYFLAICQYGKISVASEQLHVSGPTISVSIKQLEDELGLQLFTRSKGQLSLSIDGLRLQDKASKVVDGFDRIKGDLKRTQDEMPVIRLGTPSTLGEYLCSRLISEYTDNTSSVLFEMPSLSSFEAAQQVEDEKIELAICDQLGVNSRHLAFSTIIDSTLSGYVRHDSPLAGKCDVTPQMLSEDMLILLSKKAMFSNEVLRWFRDANIKPNVFMYSQREIMSVTISMVERHNAVAFFLDELFASRMPQTIKSFSMYPQLSFRIGIVRKKNVALSKEAQKFHDFCCNYQF